MKKSILSFVASMVASLSAHAVDTDLRVLAVTTGGVNSNIAYNQMQFLKQNWEGFGGTNIRLVNNGHPVVLTTALYTNGSLKQLTVAANHPEWSNYRNAFAGRFRHHAAPGITQPKEQCRAPHCRKGQQHGENKQCALRLTMPSP
jgi:hypothetical protein